jgi:hypothetical protein
MRLSAFRFLFLMLGEVGVADSKRQAPPLLFPSATLFALQTWRDLQNSGADALREWFVIASDSEAIQLGAGELDCFVAELVIGPATSGRTRWLLAMRAHSSTSPVFHGGD